MRYAARRDNVEPELIGFARQLGGKLFQSGPMDWWLLHLGEWIPVEIKDPSVAGHKHEYTKAQRRFLDFAREHGGRVVTWRTQADVMRTLGARQAA